MLRLNIGPSPRIIDLPQDYTLVEGRGVTLVDGGEAILFGYGPVMLNEALFAAQLLNDKGFHLKVVNMPWLNRVDHEWLIETIGEMNRIFVLEDHAPVGGLGDTLLNAGNQIGLWNNRTFRKFAVEGYPACGTPPEALKFHGLDGQSLAERILQYSNENVRT